LQERTHIHTSVSICSIHTMPVTSARAAKTGKGISKTAARKMVINHRATDAAVAGELEETHTFGRITKALGFCQMLLKLADGREALATIRGALKGGGPTRMKVGDVVVVETIMGEGGAGAGATHKGTGATHKGATRKDPTHLIVGVLEGKQITILRKAGSLPEWMTRVGETGEEATAAAACGYAWEERDEEGGEEGGEEEVDVSKI
jgi:translation initiation factor IF-1